MSVNIKLTENGIIRINHYRTHSKKTAVSGNGSPKTRNYKAESLGRAKRTIIDYADNNDFNYFVTLTFDKTKIDRDDGRHLYESVKQAMKHYIKTYLSECRYILVPELHSDGIHFHFHGLIFIPEGEGDLSQHWDRRKHCHYWQSSYFFKKFGACRFDYIFSNGVAASRYISKYITKETEKAFPLTYLCSRSLKKSRVIWASDNDALVEVIRAYENDPIVKEVARPPFKNEYVECFELDGTLFQFFEHYLLQFGWHCDKIPYVTSGSDLLFNYVIVSPDGECYINSL